MTIAALESARILTELRAVGVDVSDVYDLVNATRTPPQAIPVLVSALSWLGDDSPVLEGVVRALGSRHARGKAGQPLLDLFERLPHERWALKWAVGNSLASVISKGDVARILAVAKDARHGRSREMLVLALARFPGPDVTEFIRDLLAADEMTLHALQASRRAKLVELQQEVLRYSDDSRVAVRRAAKRALEVFE